ncbi:MAG: hypothetical protein KIH08_02120 [Candidatus Freyarchaeota archaeon]|nr:hypothetical protein [Candidatus Jordarchaeia archaeon]MBS7268247.1 hypothetical protein [Candidatus Jordarchaeia archaeon]MBS7279532.1 hypothetical protein [Candidatus Jordarchaeia archaeon]
MASEALLDEEDIQAFLEQVQETYKTLLKTKEHKTTDDLILLNNLCRSMIRLKFLLERKRNQNSLSSNNSQKNNLED